MGWKFFGYASVFKSPDKSRTIFLPGCYSNFLKEPDHLAIPMLNGHQTSERIGRWLKMEEDDFGLLVWGELFYRTRPMDLPFPGISVGFIDAPPLIVPDQLDPWHFKMFFSARLSEISLVPDPTHPEARILGSL
jgi:HK97 family phage prohead protease